MRGILPKKLHILAKNCPKPLYVVGGATRDFLAGLTSEERDIDLSSPMRVEEFLPIAEKSGFSAVAVYKNTGTVKLKDGTGERYEYTSFRSDKYVRGLHTPTEIFFTEDVTLDARRRDFTANAVYYDIANETFVDPLGGIAAIQEKRLTTVDNPEKVFGEDGLRLMRLARQAGQTGFSPDEKTKLGAKKNAALIKDISPERIFTELTAILQADEKYGVEYGHYFGLKLLDEIGVLEQILPELTLGRDMRQRPDFHKHTVLEHSLRTTRYATNEVRLAALLHDVGKPYCVLRDGNSHDHPIEGARIASEILTRFKAPKKTVAEVSALVLWHMYDFDLKTKEGKLRRFFVEHTDILEKILAVKQADYSGCMDDLSLCPTAKKWQTVLDKMRLENAPFTLKDLAITGRDLAKCGFAPSALSALLKRLLLHAAINPKENEKSRLITLAKIFYKELTKENL